MINKTVHLLIIDNEVLFAEDPIELLLLLYGKEKMYASGGDRIVSEDDFTYWLVSFIVRFKLIYTQRLIEYILNRIEDEDKRFKAFTKEMPIILFNELYLRMQPEILYTKLDKDSIQGLIDLLMLRIPDKEYAEAFIKQLVDEINNDLVGFLKIKY